jgi:hypothetical protein
MQVTEITNPAQRAQEFNGDLREYLTTNFVIEGRTMTEWKRHFFVSIPDDLNFATIVRLTQDIARKYQEASRFRDEFSVQLALLDQGRAPRYNEAYNNVRAEHDARNTGRTLAAESCRAAANAALSDLDDAIANQKIVKNFWSETCKTLVEMRKNVEIIGRALAGDSYTQREMTIRAGDRS